MRKKRRRRKRRRRTRKKRRRRSRGKRRRHVISGFRSEVAENCTVVGHYAASGGNTCCVMTQKSAFLNKKTNLTEVQGAFNAVQFRHISNAVYSVPSHFKRSLQCAITFKKQSALCHHISNAVYLTSCILVTTKHNVKRRNIPDDRQLLHTAMGAGVSFWGLNVPQFLVTPFREKKLLLENYIRN